MQISKKSILALGLLAASITGLGVAAAHEGEGGKDRSARRAEILAKYDTNKDGKLDDNEKKAMRDDMAAIRFKKLDTNNDGVISLDEFKAGFEQMGHRHFGHHRK